MLTWLMFATAVAMHITTWLRNDNGSDVEYSYEALKAYQMLYQPKHYDGKFLHSWVMLNLQRNLPQNVTSPYRYGTQSTHASGISEAKSGAP